MNPQFLDLVLAHSELCSRQHVQPVIERWQSSLLAKSCKTPRVPHASGAWKALAVLLLAFNRAPGSPPVARRIPHKVAIGKVAGENRGPNPIDPAIELSDDYFWLRDDSRTKEEVLGLLREENAYTEERTKHLESFRGRLLKEMLSHLQREDGTYPSPSKDGYEYWSCNVKGSPCRQYMRRKRGTSRSEELLLQWDAAQYQLGDMALSPSGDILAYSLDDKGYEVYNIGIRDLKRGVELDERIHKVSGVPLVWADDATLFYVKRNDQNRAYQVWRHTLGTQQAADVLVYEESDELFSVDCWVSRDGSLLFLSSRSKETTELHFIPTTDLDLPPTCIRPREGGVRYKVSSHAPSRSLFIVSNVDGKMNQELLVASLDSPSTWSPLLAADSQVLAHAESRFLNSVDAFSNFLVVGGRADGFTQLWVVPLVANSSEAVSDAHCIDFDADAFAVRLASNDLFESNGKLRVVYSSMIAPSTLLEYDVNSRTIETLRVKAVPNYDASLYQTARMEVIARDGVTVPVTLLWRPDAVGDTMAAGGGGAPCHMMGYGAYGASEDPRFDASILPLVDRGIVYAIAHVRGGGEMGYHAWYEAGGKYLTKRNTFNDFVDCAKALLERGVAKPGALTCEGVSAGGLVIGNAVNMAPELFAGAVAKVPFVDVMVTMCDPTIPGVIEEWEEWGNPNDVKYHEYMMSYCPINNVRDGKIYPSMLIKSGLNDRRVQYWEPTKWVQVLRSRIANGDDVLLRTDLAGGHFGTASRYEYFQELAFDYAWLLDKLGKAERDALKGGGSVRIALV